MRLVVFDVDGTLSDSQANICAAMERGFAAMGLAPPSRAETLSIVGLSLPLAVARLAPEADEATVAGIVEGYKSSYFAGRTASPAPLYPGARACLLRLAARDDLILGIATGKSRRGLDALITYHQLEGLFVTRQVADDHPSKPNPEMLRAALSEAGVGAAQAVMVGDTSFDIEMAGAAGVAGIGVSWGYHPVAQLQQAGARRIVDSFEALEVGIDELLGVSA